MAPGGQSVRTRSWDGAPSIGIAYSGYTREFLRRHGDAVDYVEVPFELLVHDPSVIEIGAVKPIVLHCASLSVAGSVPPAEATIAAISDWIDRTRSPWLGEHLSFITAEREAAGPMADEYAPGEPYNIGYTVCPSMNEEAVERVLRSIMLAEDRLAVPMILENPPIYFPVPGSAMTQLQFVAEICERSDTRLLLDLAHFYITSQTMGFDPLEAISDYPLERVVEVHLSGVETEAGGHWDNHARRAPEIEFELLSVVLERATVRGITLEYNWSARFPPAVLLEEIERARARVPVS
jgi:uncharacterized protein (UPF0276 family)